MSDRKFDLGDYVEVKDRIAIFYELYPQGRLVTGKVYTELGPDGTPRVVVKAKAYRTPDDPLPGRGSSWMSLPGTTSYTKGSELENTETSAWGRAIASLGILVDKSIASAQEVQNKAGQEPKRGSGFVSDTPHSDTTHDGGLIGTVEVGKTRDSDFEVRKSGDDEHFTLGFKLKSNGGGFKVLTRDELALQLLDAKAEVVGKRVTVWGRISTVEPNPGDRWRAYQVIAAERVQTPGGMLPISPLRAESSTPAGFVADSIEKALRDPEDPEPIPVVDGQVAFKLDPEERALIGGDAT
jgi:hypothetical protein